MNQELLIQRPRRNRKNKAIRSLVRENVLLPTDFVWPLFLTSGSNKKEAIASMPGVFRHSLDLLIKEVKLACDVGIQAIALFPAIEDKLKDQNASEATNANGLLPQAVSRIKKEFPELLVITDVALDPYSSDGHDGIVENGKILNDLSVEVLANMALTQAEAGADIVAPSDMMDGRVGKIRERLDSKGYEEVGILSYTAKYASSFYGPFRDALESAPKHGDKKTYQMDPANGLEADREMLLDIEEGADIVMVKPALSYLDVIQSLKSHSTVPVAAYQVSGELAMIEAASEKGWLDRTSIINESLLSIKRAGADIIFSYYAREVAQSL